MISAVFRRGGDVTFVAEKLKAVFDPEGGRWMAGRYVPSLLAAIGDVIEEHMIRTGFMVPQIVRDDGPAIPAKQVLARDAEAQPSSGATPPAMPSSGSIRASTHTGRVCPRCGTRNLHRIEGCWTCSECQYSHCG